MKTKMNIKNATLYSLVIVLGLSAMIAMIPEKQVAVTLENEFIKSLYDKFNVYSNKTPEDRVYLQFDKPFYNPGETIWFSAYVRDGKTMYASDQSDIVHAELISPKGTTIKTIKMIAKKGKAVGDFNLDADVPGGMYKVKAYTNWQKNEGEDHLFEKEFQVQKVVLPNLKMKLDFKRKAYGPGDQVNAKLELNTNANQPLSNQKFWIVASLKGEQFVQKEATTDENGKHTIQFDLPHDLNTSDGLLNVMIAYEGKNESISRSIPISLNNISLSFYPEGGDLVEGLESRVAFKALNEFGKPADVEGEVLDNQGQKVAWFKSFHNGMGAFDFEPKKDVAYTVRLTKPEGIDQDYVMPEALPRGFVLNTSNTKPQEVELTINSTEQEVVSLMGQVRGKIYYANSVKISKGTNRIAVSTKEFPMGIAQFTLFDGKNVERAERLVFVNRDRQLNIAISTDKEKYQPREKVNMTIKVSDERGMPMPANLSMSVVNDQLLSFADDKSGNILSGMLLAYDIKEKIEEPAFYFDKKGEKADKALDYLMLTAGWRRFTWEMVQNNQFPVINFLAEKTILGGKVYDAYTRKPIAGAYVQIPQMANQKATVDKEGVFEFSSIELSGTATLSVIAQGYYTQNRNAYAYGANYDFYLYPIQNQQSYLELTGSGASRNMRTKSSSSAIHNIPVADHVDFAMAPEPAGMVVQKMEAENISKKATRIMVPAPNHDVKAAKGKADQGKKMIPQEEPLALLEMKDNKRAESKNELARDQQNMNKMILKDAEMDGLMAEEHLGGMDLFDDIDENLANEVQNGAQQQEALINSYYRAKQFPVTKPAPLTENTQRNDFRATIYWNGNVDIDRSGKASVEFYTSDEITSFRTTVEGISSDGMVGRSEKTFFTQLPFSLAAKAPVEVATEDKVTIPITLKNNTEKTISGFLKVLAPLAFRQISQFAKLQTLNPGEATTIYVDYEVMSAIGEGTFEASFVACGLTDAFTKTIKTVAKGFPVTYSFSGNEIKNEYTINLHDVVEGSITAELNAYPSVVSDLITGVESILREPSGCFEQTSMSSYPNVMVLDYMKTQEIDNSQVMAKAEGMIDRGYKRLTTFETKSKGYEWFGQSPAHEGLTAYGLMQFNDMKKVYGNVDESMIDRTAKWIMSKRDGTGKFKRNTDRQLHNFGRISEDVMNAYITYALIDAGFKDLDKELAYSCKRAEETKDPYLLALMVNAAYAYGDVKKGDDALAKLLAAQKEDGSITGTTHSITYSTGISLSVETTALTILGMLQAPGPNRIVIDKAVKYLVSNRSGYGSFGNTQGTILALKALTTYAKASKTTKEDGIIQFYVDGKKVAERAYVAGSQDAIKLDSLGQYIGKGKHTLKVKFVGVKEALPYSLAVSYSTKLPNSSDLCKVKLDTKIASTTARVGETVRLSAKIKNLTNEGIPSTIAIIGIPAGLSAQPWQLKELQEKKVFSYYEVRGNNIVAYYRGLAPNETKEINLDLKAEVPGEFDAPASSAYLYYTNEYKSWNSVDRITVRK